MVLIYIIAFLVQIFILYLILVAIHNKRLRKESYKHMSEYDKNATIGAEQESLRQQEEKTLADEKAKELQNHEKQRLEKDRLTEEKRLAEERQNDYERNQEEIKKDSERRRQADRDRKEQQRQQEDLRKAQEELKRIENEQKALEQKEMEEPKKKSEHIPQSQELMDLANTQTMFERQIRAESQVKAEYNRAIEKHDTFKEKVETLDKLNKSIEQTKDKVLLTKYKANKESLEKDIERDYGISKEKPKFLQSKEKKAEVERDYRDKLQDKMNGFAKDKEYAVKSLEESKQNRDYLGYEQSIRDKVPEKVNGRNQTQTNSRGR